MKIRPDLKDNIIAQEALWLFQRPQVLANHGLYECDDCKSWINQTRAAVSFHYRRCTG